MLFINGTVDVGDDVQFENTGGGSSIGGIGRINMFGSTEGIFDLEPGAHLRPGPDPAVNDVGTLTVNLFADTGDFGGSFFEVKPDSTYHLEFAEEGGAVVHDAVDLLAQFGLSFLNSYLALERDGDKKWNLELSALEDLGSLVSPTDQFELFTIGDFVRLLDFDTQVDTLFTAPIISGMGEIESATILPSPDFDISNAKVMYDIGSGTSRIYVTGLSYNGPSASRSAAPVPEPTAGLLVLLATVSLSAMRNR
jgi:hypothetical protein